MALKPGVINKAIPSHDVPEVPDEIPRGQGGRPKIRALVQAEDGSWSQSETLFITYTRASTLGNAIKDKFGVWTWKLRAVMFGASRHEALVAKACVIENMTDKENKDALDELAEEMLNRVGTSDGAIKGTVLHKLSEWEDQGKDLSYLPANFRNALAAYRRLIALVRVVSSEQFVVCDELEAAGTYDRIVELLTDVTITYKDENDQDVTETIPAGTRLILDLKTNKTANYFGAEYLVQEAVYGNGVPYTARDGRGTWPDGEAPSTEWGLILHVPSESPEDSGYYLVPLKIGMKLARLACSVREWQNCSHLFIPTDLKPGRSISEASCDKHGPHPGTADCVYCIYPDSTNAEAIQGKNILALINQADSPDAITELWRANEAEWTDELTEAAKARVEELRTRSRADEPLSDSVTLTRGQALMNSIKAARAEIDLNDLWRGYQDTWTDEHTEAAKSRAAELRAREDEALEFQGAAEDQAGGNEKPAQVVALELAVKLRQAPSEEALTAIWKATPEDMWRSEHTQMVKARLRELSAAVSE